MRYIMLYKPAGTVSARCDKVYPAALDLIEDPKGLHIAGRLDRDAEGLLIITDDGDLTLRLTNPKYGIRKRYRFMAFGSLENEDIEKAAKGGITLGGGSPSKPAYISDVSKTTVSEASVFIPGDMLRKCMKNPNGSVTSGTVEVSEGKFHEVKQILWNLGCKVFRLKRISVGEIELDGSLLPGQYRCLNEEEEAWCRDIRGIYI